jgi:SAM-dependent methyltransferase
MTSPTATTRFSNRVEDYVKYRPHYPAEAIDHIVNELALHPGSMVADLGSGTGISARPLLEWDIIVYGVEPNEEMRDAQEKYLGQYLLFRSVNGTSESTTLAPASIDHAIAAQAFHWFDPEATRAELSRILRPNGKLALLWNERQTATTDFLREYEALLHQFSTDYELVDHRNINEAKLDAFFQYGYSSANFSNIQRVDYDGLLGRLRSSSYVPAKGETRFDEMVSTLESLYAKHQKSGYVDLLYDCKVFIGRIT